MDQIALLQQKMLRLEKNKEADRLFTENMQFFCKQNNSLYKKFENYKPKSIALAFDQNGDVNLLNASGRFVYPENPAVYAEKQVDSFLNSAKPYTTSFHDPRKKNCSSYIHDEMMDGLINLYPSRKKVSVPNDDDVIQLIISCGMGAGLHIEKLLQKKAIKNIVIYENNLDALYTSLYFIDWKDISQKISGALEVVVEEDDEVAFTRFKGFFSEVGFYNLSKYYVYYHYQNAANKRFVDNFQRHMKKMTYGYGFYDDERVGLAHTLENIERKYPVSRISLLQRGEIDETPVVIVGNGPSLDESIEFIKKHKHSLIVISCGSSFGTLKRLGIKPDMHLEQERPLVTYHWLKSSTDEEIRKGVYFFGLNTVHPDCFSLFDEDKAFQCIKPNDLGLVYLAKSLEKIENNTLALADGCNPTVTNFGVSLCTLLGLKNIYLAGVDFGMSDLEVHHSKSSDYFEGEQDADNEAEHVLEQLGAFKTPAAQGGDIWTNDIFDISRKEMERIISNYGLNVTNLGDGAKIEGAKYQNPKELTMNERGVDKVSLISNLVSRAFYHDGLNYVDKHQLKNQIKDKVHLINSRMLTCLETPVANEAGAMKLISQMYNVFEQSKPDRYTYMLLVGGLQYLTSAMASVISTYNADDIPDVFQQVKLIAARYLIAQVNDIEEHFFELDRYSTLEN